MQCVTGFAWHDNDVWDLAEKLRPVLAARFDEMVRHDCRWVLEYSATDPAPTMAEAARRLAENGLDSTREPRVWIIPFDDKLLVADLSGFYGSAIAAIEGMEDISVELPDPDADQAALERRRRNVALWEEAAPTRDVRAHGLRVEAPEGVGLQAIIAAVKE